MRIQLGLRQEGVAREVLVDAPAGTSAAQLAQALGASSPHGCLLVGTRPVAPHVLLGSEPLLHGAVVTVASGTEGRSGAEVVETTAPSRWLLRVESGPDVGLLLRLRRGPLVVGRAVDCPLRLTDPGVSRRHLELVVDAGMVTARDLNGTNGTWVEGVHSARCRRRSEPERCCVSGRPP